MAICRLTVPVAHSAVCQCCFSWLQTSLNQQVICVLLDLTALVRAHMTETHDRVTPYNTSRAPRRGSGVWFMNKLIIFNEPVQSVRKSQQTIHFKLQWSDCSCSRVENSLIQNDPFRASLSPVNWTHKYEPGDLVSARYWCCEKYVTKVEF